MTKKEERAARIAADKRAAYFKRVRTLIGHVQERLPTEYLNAAYDSGKTADEFAAEIASREPVGKAVHPLKVEAVARAAKNAKTIVESVRAEMEKAEWDLEIAAPYPDSRGMNEFEYHRAVDKHNRFCRLTKSVNGFHSPGKPDIRTMSDEGIERFVKSWEDGAAFQYDAFICKLVAKVGECTAATIQGSHVWGESILTVQKGFNTERWRTHQIENVSKLGLYFPQWPTRLIKEAHK